MLKNQWSSEADMILQPANDEEVLEKKMINLTSKLKATAWIQYDIICPC
jgi:hypothetical protein